VVFALAVVIGAALLAAAMGGRLSGFTTLDMRGVRYLTVAVVSQALAGVLAASAGTSTLYLAGLALSAAAALVFCVINRQLPGVALVTAGLVSNALVVGLNGAMPVSIFAASRAGVSIESIAAGNDPRHTVAGYGSTWRALGDVIPVPLPVVPEVISPGDVLVAAGLGELMVVGMRRRPAPREVASRQESAVALPG
jgi:hypothetical protein